MEEKLNKITNLIYDKLLKHHYFRKSKRNKRKECLLYKETDNAQIEVAFGPNLFFGIIVYHHRYFPDSLIEKLIETIKAFEKDRFINHLNPLDYSQRNLFIGGTINIETIDDILIVFENYKKLQVEAEKIGDIDNETFAVTRLDPKDTGLPLNIYTDSCNFFIDHRIKFIPGLNPDLTYLDAVSMSVSDNPEILDENASIDLSIDVIEQIKLFVKNNKDLLLHYSNGEIEVLDFFKSIKKGG